MTHNILLTDGLEANGQEILRAAAHVDDRNGLPPAALLEQIGGYDALIVRGRTKVTAAVFAAAPRLKVVGRSGVGVDNIDLAAARERGVIVVNAPTSTSLAVAELTLGLMLALARQIPRADASMKAGEWAKNALKGVELNGKTLGIVGMGRIGTEVGRRAAAFGMTLLGYDPLIPADRIAAAGAEPVALDAIFTRSDYITLHIPLTPETRGLIGAEALARMKPGVRLICTARGGIIDETALLAALESGQVAGAGLDVFAAEPPGRTPLVAHPQVVCSPHLGAQTQEAQERAAADIATEVLRALNGESLRWRIP